MVGGFFSFHRNPTCRGFRHFLHTPNSHRSKAYFSVNTQNVAMWWSSCFVVCIISISNLNAHADKVLAGGAAEMAKTARRDKEAAVGNRDVSVCDCFHASCFFPCKCTRPGVSKVSQSSRPPCECRREGRKLSSTYRSVTCSLAFPPANGRTWGEAACFLKCSRSTELVTRE